MRYLFILIMLFPVVALAQYKTSDCDGKCGKDLVCVLNDDGLYYCTKAPTPDTAIPAPKTATPNNAITGKCNPPCPKGQKCVKMTDGSYQCISVSPNQNPNSEISPNPNPNKCIPPCPKGQKCTKMEDGSYECFPIVPNPDPNIGVNPNPDPSALAGPDNAVPQHNCSLVKIKCPYNLIIIILLIINIVLTFKIYRRR